MPRKFFGVLIFVSLSLLSGVYFRTGSISISLSEENAVSASACHNEKVEQKTYELKTNGSWLERGPFLAKELVLSFHPVNALRTKDASLQLEVNFFRSTTISSACRLANGQWQPLHADYYPFLVSQTTSSLILPEACVAHSTPAVKLGFSKWTPIDLKSISLRLMEVDDSRSLANTRAIEAYTDRISYPLGDRVSLKVHSPQSPFSLEVIRFGAKDNTVLKKRGVEGNSQAIPPRAYRLGAGWNESTSFEVGKNWKGGLYGAKVCDGSGCFTSTFTVRGKSKTPIALIASTNTWQAYNSWGGGSFYESRHRDCLGRMIEAQISDQRPNPVASPYYGDRETGLQHLTFGELFLIRALEKMEYPYELYSDRDLDEHPEILRDHALVILNVHSEYWTDRARDGFADYMNNGGFAFVAGGNTLYTRIAREGSVQEVQHYGQFHELDGKKGGNFRDLGKDETSLIGLSYTALGAATFAPYRIFEPKHWAFEGTGLNKDDFLGKYASDADGASGHETDKPNINSPKNLTILARGENPDEGGAYLVHFETPSGGQVFNVGSISFTRALSYDARVERIVNNVLSRFLKDAQRNQNRTAGISTQS